VIAALTSALLTLAAVAPAQERILLSDPLVQASPQATDRLAFGTELRLYDIEAVNGYARLRERLAKIRTTADPTRLSESLELMAGLQKHREEVQTTSASLVATLTEMIEPKMEANLQRLEYLGAGSMALVGTPDQHMWMTRFLDSGTEFQGLIDVQARVYILEKGQLSKLSQAKSGEVLNQAQFKALIDALDKAGVESVTAPRLTTYPFQEADMRVIDQVAYIKDYELKVIPEQDAEIADPVIDVVHSGVVMKVRGMPLADGQLSVFASLDYSTLKRPIKTLETTLGASGHTLTVQVPEVTKVKLQGRFNVHPTEALLLATVDPQAENEVLVLVRAARIGIIDSNSSGKNRRR
jgi:hypothetical protein